MRIAIILPITALALLGLAASRPAAACTRVAYAEAPHAACLGETLWGTSVATDASLPAREARGALLRAVRDTGRWAHQGRAMAAYGYALSLLPEDGQITYRAWLDALTAGWRATR